MKKRILGILLVTMMIMSCIACGKKEDTSSENKDKEEKKTEIVIGVWGGQSETVNLAEPYMNKKGYTFKTVAFDSNAGGAELCLGGDIDCFILNHKPWIDQYNKDNGTDLYMMKDMFYTKEGLYSLKYKSIDEIPDGSTIAISNDASNMDKTLTFLQDLGLLKLGEKTEDTYTLLDITENPHNYNFEEVEITQLVRSLDECAAAYCFSSQLSKAGYDVDGYLVENDAAKAYCSGLTLKKEDKDSQWAKDFQAVFDSEEYQKDFNDYYKGAASIKE